MKDARVTEDANERRVRNTHSRHALCSGGQGWKPKRSSRVHARREPLTGRERGSVEACKVVPCGTDTHELQHAVPRQTRRGLMPASFVFLISIITLAEAICDCRTRGKDHGSKEPERHRVARSPCGIHRRPRKERSSCNGMEPTAAHSCVCAPMQHCVAPQQRKSRSELRALGELALSETTSA